MRLGKNDRAIEFLESCIIPEGSYPFHYLEFVLGNAKLFRFDKGAARHFLNYTNHHTGSNYIKSAYQRLAWLSLIKGDQHAYRFYMSQVLQHGTTFVDEDRQAQTEAEDSALPNIRLLKARLLFDGGYFEAALEILDNETIKTDISSQKDSVEFVYRKARIFHEWNNVSLAKDLYMETIEQGSNLSYFFAGNAALQLGLLYESEENYLQAAYYYNLCLNMRFTEYRKSIQHKARAGSRRVAGKK